ncbi:Glycosyl hydrolase family 45 [Fibrobacter sp. UWT2]|uniref:glycosyl hydrolase family 5 n=1 Tax=Fibrobacter sp. UWT2 TaxID=1896224 RepID=UPI000913D78D|nr:glycosyl hydrolase family 5 [Fibrobacter sp. UWT2]SHL69918.1 Glycosyl hydrolase family 45 [Fibrobacter sp. UWT2]
MNRKLFKSLIAASAVAMICACGDEAASNNATNPNSVVDPGTGLVDNPGSTPVVTDPSNPGNTQNPGTVTDPTSNVSDTSVTNPTNPGNTTNPGDPQNPASSSGVNPQNPDDPITTPITSSNSVNTEPELGPDGFPTLESYGAPSPEYTKDISATAKRGWNTRYWDACKPHCSWLKESSNDKTRADTSSNEAFLADYGTARNCNIHDVEVPTFTLGDVSKAWFGYNGTRSACGDEKEKGVFTCTDMAPIAVNDTLSYAYVAGTADSKCGKCYHLQYDGHFANEMENNPPRETHKALKGKHMIVMASNIGMDVAGGNPNLPAGQFDLMVPGGGVGAFDALTTQVKKGSDFNWGAGFGGFLTECQNQLGYDATLVAYQTCIKDMCDAAFGDAGLPNLLRGCHWFADWYMAADNPTYYIEEVECPQYLIDHYMSRYNTSLENNFKKVTDWSTFKEGDVLDTLHCWKAGEAPPENGWQNPSAGCDVQ